MPKKSSTEFATANSLYYSGTQSGTASINIGTSMNPAYRMPRYYNYNHQSISANRPQSPAANNAINNTTKASMYSYSNYYTWAAAMANTAYYASPTYTDTYGETSETVSTSICPSGWALPYGRISGNGSTSGGFSYLDSHLGGTGGTQSTAVASNRWRTFPNNFLYSGRLYSSNIDGNGFIGYYWTSTASSAGYSYILYLNSSSLYPGTKDFTQYSGGSIRCVLSSS